MTHLKFDIYAYTGDHPQIEMARHGIVYQHATPQSMGDCWWFWNCKNIPDTLPERLSVLTIDPMHCIGFGLSKEQAEAIRDAV